MIVVDLTGIAVAVFTAGSGIVAKVVIAEIRAKIKNKQMADLLANAVANSLGKIQQAGDAEIAHASYLHPDLKSPNLAVGVQYVIDHAGEALAHFGITPDAVADKIEAKIGLAAIATNIAAAAPPLTPVTAAAPGALLVPA